MARRAGHGSGRLRLGSVLLAAALAGLGAGCGPALYTSRIRAAEQRADEANDENARWYAPYEYYFAEAHLQQAELEAADAAYEDAIQDARTAESFFARALAITKAKRQAEQ